MMMIFYFLVACIGMVYFSRTFSDLGMIKSTHEKLKSGKTIKEISNDFKIDGEDRNDAIILGCTTFLSMGLCIVGLFSVQWPLFLGIIIFAVAIGQIQKLTIPYLSLTLFISRCNYMVVSLTYIFSVINYYHLNINLVELIKTIL